jgi:hypothetical protein
MTEMVLSVNFLIKRHKLINFGRQLKAHVHYPRFVLHVRKIHSLLVIILS